jgi:quercetin dioxygenase-like cupin family protein
MKLLAVVLCIAAFAAPVRTNKAQAQDQPRQPAPSAPDKLKDMGLPISTKNAEHYTWGDPSNPCDGWYLVQSEDLNVIEERMPPGAFEQRHRHQKSRQFFYVLSGELTMEADGTQHIIHAGEGIEIAPGVAHQAMNNSKSDLRILVTSQPPSHADRQPA